MLLGIKLDKLEKNYRFAKLSTPMYRYNQNTTLVALEMSTKQDIYSHFIYKHFNYYFKYRDTVSYIS